MQKDTPIRDLKPALWRGINGKCPRCGRGRLLYRYLKVHDHCAHCHEPLFHHRADDGPAYLTILIVGHLIAPVLHFAFVYWRPEPWLLALVLCTLSSALSLILLPRIKGAIIAFQWAKYMGGFGR